MLKAYSVAELDQYAHQFFTVPGFQMPPAPISTDVRQLTLEELAEFYPTSSVSEKDPMASIMDSYDRDAVNKARFEPKCQDDEVRPIYESDQAVQEYVHISDLHLPFHQDKWMKAVIEEHSFKGKTLIINGDFLDCHDVSSFPKSRAVGLGNEVALAKGLLRDWAKRFDKIYLVAGNHEKRMATYIRKRISPEVVSLVEDDILKNIVDDIKLPNIVYMTGDTTNWYVQIDNVICCHPNDYKRSTSGILHTATFALPYFEAHHPDATVFVMAHTHHLGIGIYRGKVVAESGCLCQTQDYAASGNLAYTPQARGYVTFTSRNKKVTFNDIRLHYLG